MNKTINKLKDGVLFGIGALFVFGIANAWVNLSTVGPGDSLTDTIWNEMVTKLNDTGQRASGIFTDGSSNVGIGTNTPSDKLHMVGGNIKLQNIGSSIYLTDNSGSWRNIIRTSPDSGNLGDFEIVSGNGTESNRTRYAPNGIWYFPTTISVAGNVNMGYEIVSDTRSANSVSSYTVSCPAGKYVLSASARTSGGWMEVAKEINSTSVTIFADTNQFPSQLASGIITRVVCARIGN
ncbi:MAG: hypothetical protein PHS49_03975 [Candidatus Gracilibacteria bacterium]|nr:hypothetical protein [Candidatus Gracilibacteria bacterium]